MNDAFYRSIDEVIQYFGTNPQTGLTSEQVEENCRRYGKNELPPPKRTSWFKLVLKQFEDLLVLILLGSAIISLILGFLEEKESITSAFIEPCVILLILICNAIVGVWQESNAEEAIEQLKKFEAKHAIVIRDNKQIKIDRDKLVPGDIVVLSVGDKVPADIRLIFMESRILSSDESMLTGESVAQIKQLEPIKSKNNNNDINGVVDQDKKNMLFSGTLVVHGRGRGIVVLTGTHTSIGKIQGELMNDEEHKTPLSQKLDEFAEFLSKIILAICIIVWLMNINHFGEHGNWLKGAIYYFKIAVSLAVAAIPEGLPAVVTTCLALGTRKMAKKNAIVRSLPSVETLGCTTVICSDKTGTLTTNQMSVRQLFVMGNDKDTINIESYNVTGTTYEPKGDIISITGNSPLQYPCSKPSLRLISQICTLCNDALLNYEVKDLKDRTDNTNLIQWSITGEPTEGALKILAEKLSLPDAEEAFQSKLFIRSKSQPDQIHSVFHHDHELLKENYNAVHKFWNNIYTRESVLEFTRDRKSMSVFVKHKKTDEGLLLVKGAPESILERCDFIFAANNHHEVQEEEVKITENIKHDINEKVAALSSQGLRCLALAYKTYGKKKFVVENETTNNFLNIESNLTFVGVVGMLDPPRNEVKEAIRTCNDAGIRVIVITGDNKKTAEAICREIGLFDKNENLASKSYEGAQFFSLSNEEQSKIIKTASLFSRVMPSHKYSLVELLQKQGEVVAMTGDGVNDAPALKKADIGIGMGSGTEVARHASDMILADDNFASIVSAVGEGRAIYSNTKQFIRYLISSNIGEVVCIFLTFALRIPESLIPVQLLWVNLVTDGLPATALGFNRPDRDIMTHPPRGRTEKIINGWMFLRYLLIGTYVGFATVYGFIWWFVQYKNGPQVTFGQLSHFHSCGLDNQNGKKYFADWTKEDCNIFHDYHPGTMALSILVTIEMFNTFNALSENQSLLSNLLWSNVYVILAVATSMLLHCMILYVEFFRSVFNTTALNKDEWTAVVVISFPIIILDEILKFISRNIEARKKVEKKKVE